MHNIEKLLTVPQASEMEGVSRQTIYTWMNTGILPYIRKGAQRLIVPEALMFASSLMAEAKKGVNLRKKNRKKK